MSEKILPTLEEFVLEDIIETIDDPRYTDEMRYKLILICVESYKKVINNIKNN